MNNILKNIFLTFVIIIVLLTLGVVLIIKQWDNFKERMVIIGVMVMVIAVGLWTFFPYLQDLKYNETISFEGVFIKDFDATFNAPYGGTKYYFDIDEDGEEDNYFRDSFLNGSKYVCEKGQRYRVAIYKHSHTIYSLEKIE